MADVLPTVVLDTSAWFELLGDTPRGRKINDLITDKQLLISSMSITELCSIALHKGLDDEKLFRDVLSRAYVIYVDSKAAIHAARLYHVMRKKKPKFSYGDALAYMAADDHEALFITCDNDFSGMKNATVVR